MEKSPKEYAEELVNEIQLTQRGFIIPIIIAKQIAKIAVDKILLAIDWHEFEVPNKQIEYFEQVKTEIENL